MNMANTMPGRRNRGPARENQYASSSNSRRRLASVLATPVTIWSLYSLVEVESPPCRLEGCRRKCFVSSPIRRHLESQPVQFLVGLLHPFLHTPLIVPPDILVGPYCARLVCCPRVVEHMSTGVSRVQPPSCGICRAQGTRLHVFGCTAVAAGLAGVELAVSDERQRTRGASPSSCSPRLASSPRRSFVRGGCPHPDTLRLIPTRALAVA